MPEAAFLSGHMGMLFLRGVSGSSRCLQTVCADMAGGEAQWLFASTMPMVRA